MFFPTILIISAVCLLLVRAKDNEKNYPIVRGVYVYPPEHFDMYTKCDHEKPPQIEDLKEDTWNTLKNSVDYFFTKAVTNPEFLRSYNTSPDKASVFVLPVFCSQSSLKRCGDHQANIKQMHSYLKKSPWFIRHSGRDHLIICDHWRSPKHVYELLPNLIYGHKEPMYKRHGDISVGLTTHNPLLTHTSYEIIPLAKRTYDLFFVGRTIPYNNSRILTYYGYSYSKKQVYDDRHRFICDYLFLKDKPANVFIDSAGDTCNNVPFISKNLNLTVSMRMLADTRTVPLFTGTTPLSDRLYNIFETETVPIVLSTDLPMILDVVPFAHMVPWREFFHVVDEKDFIKNPVLSMTNVGNVGNLSYLEGKIELLRKYKKDVLWMTEDSRCHFYVLQQAAKIAYERTKHHKPNPVHPPKRASNKTSLNKGVK